MLHHEPVVYLPHVSHHDALLAWGAFAFHVETDGTVRRQAELDGVEQIGWRRRVGPRVEVRLWEASRPEAVRELQVAPEQQWVRLTELRPDTAYQYQLLVDGTPLLATARRWVPAERPGEWGRLEPDPSRDGGPVTFRSLPAPGQPASFTFAVLGDPGVGVDVPDSYAPERGRWKGSAQRAVAARLDRWIEQDPKLRFVLVTGDVVYARRADGRYRRRVKGVSRMIDLIARIDSGDQDDDWFFKYFLPYRRALERVPFYISAGNHDGAETELQVDRAQLVDNLLLQEAFPDQVPASPESEDNDGLSYVFSCGDVDFVALDTSLARFDHTLDGHLRVHPLGRRSRDLFQRRAARLAEWAKRPARTLVTFGHHPPQSTGPSHDRVYGHVRELFASETVRKRVSVAFWGHEHNFQLFEDPLGPVHVLTGCGGKVTGPWVPREFQDGPERFLWGASVPHFVVGEISPERAEPGLTLVSAGPASLPVHPPSTEAWQPEPDGTLVLAPRSRVIGVRR